MKTAFMIALTAMLGIASAFADTTNKHALLIGIDDYQASSAFKSLEGAKNDVRMLQDLLISRFGYEPGRIIVLEDKQATHAAIRNAFVRLAETINVGDFVYIHYSGHGSTTPDLNGDEPPHWAMDSTWVSYGARASADAQSAGNTPGDLSSRKRSGEQAVDINDFDILDDEIDVWLAAIYEKTDRVVFVSDSCHSGTITRNADAPGIRGVPMDARPHPLGEAPPSAGYRQKGVRVMASRDNQKALEIKRSGRSYGQFSWYWVESLQSAQPGETWADIFQRAIVRLKPKRIGEQEPQFEGFVGLPVFGGGFAEKSKTIPVRYIGEKVIRIDAGSLSGVTAGSIYRKQSPEQDTAELPTLKITKVEPFFSEGTATGTFKVGDFVTLETYNPDGGPLRVLVRADLELDRDLARAITESLRSVPFCKIVSEQHDSDLVLYLLRPQKDADGVYKRAKPHDSLPASFSESEPECWFLLPHEQLYHENLKIGLTDSQKGIKDVKESIERIMRLHSLLAMSSGPAGQCPISVEVKVWNETRPDQADSSRLLAFGGKRWKEHQSFSLDPSKDYNVKVGQLLTFTMSNHSEQPLYSYLIDIAPNGGVEPFFPASDQSLEHGLIPAGGMIEGEKMFALYLDEKGNQYVRLVATSLPANLRLWGQKPFGIRRNGIITWHTVLASFAVTE